MKKILLMMVMTLIMVSPVYAEEEVSVTLPEFDVILNGEVISNDHETYPFIQYKNITYIPMTWDLSAAIGLKTTWSAAEGLQIVKADTAVAYSATTGSNNIVGQSYKAKLVTFPVTVNGKTIDNTSETYPLLNYKNITYFPMTYYFMVTEFKSGYTWDNTIGLSISADENLKTETSTSIVLENVNDRSSLDTTDLFTNRDLLQTVDLTDATTLDLTSKEDITLDTAGIYILSGTLEDVTVTIDIDDEDKIQLLLNDLTVVNKDAPVFYVKSADKVFITTTNTSNHLEVTNTYSSNDDVNWDAVIYSKSDIVLNGLGNLNIISSYGNGITSKDDLKITGGHYTIESLYDSLEANDSIRIYDGDFQITSGKDALHSENDDDLSLGYIYIRNGQFEITAEDDAIRGNSIVQIDGGTIDIKKSSEGIEGTYVQINGGDIRVYASDDGINASSKSSYDVVIEVNGGEIYVVMGSGDTDAFDANGDIIINGGLITVEAVSSFDADGTVSINGGLVTVNGKVVTSIDSKEMGKPKRRFGN